MALEPFHDLLVLVRAVVSKSAVWLHVGLRDTPLRIDCVRGAYESLKRLSGYPPESEREFIVEGQKVTIYTLTVGGRERAKLSEYPKAGHGIPYMPFVKEDVLEWLFDQEMADPVHG